MKRSTIPYLVILAFSFGWMNFFYLWTSVWRDRATSPLAASIWNFVVHISEAEYFFIHHSSILDQQGNQVNVFVDEEILVLLVIIFLSSVIYYSGNDWISLLLKSVRVSSLSLIPLGVYIYVLDRQDFNLHVTTWQAYSNFLIWFTNEDLLIVATVLFLLSTLFSHFSIKDIFSAPNIRYDQPIINYDATGRRLSTTILLSIVFLTVYCALLIYKILLLPDVTSLMFVVAIAYTLVSSISLMVRFPLALSYDHTKYIDQTLEPTVAILIPSKNEENIIQDTLLAVLASDYPKDKLKIYAINDGSSDRTPEIMSHIRDEHPDQIVFVNSKLNKGKRRQLGELIPQVKEEILVMIDSDTRVYPTAIRTIVKYFSKPKIGAVCGRTGVIPVNWTTRIQAANYLTGFQLNKSAESKFEIVTCTSGCLSAYRKSAVLPFIEEWTNQKFLGVECTYGEDRGLTTLLLRDGWRTIYSPTARAETHGPTYPYKLAKQRLRWRRSFIRETLWQFPVIPSKGLGASILFYTTALTNILSPFIALAYLILIPLLFGSLSSLFLYLGGLIAVSLLYAAYTKLYSRIPVSWVFGWWLFNTFVVSFVSLYAWLRLKDNGWGTR